MGTWPELYHKDKKSRIRFWKVYTEGGTVYTDYGILGMEVVTASFEAEPKNVGKKNATTAAEQADKEAQAMWDFNLKRKYSETIDGAKEPLRLPMLAKDYKAKWVKYPWYAQPKLDGVRALAQWKDGKIVLTSRSGREWTVPKHLNEQLAKVLPEDCVFDGEIYVHGVSCQTITSWCNKERTETALLEYHIYDMPVVDGDDELTFEDRLSHLDNLSFEIRAQRSLYLVETKHIESEEKLTEYELSILEKGYEGVMVRAPKGQYLWGYRSSELLKVKRFEDAEFKVVGCKEGIGKFKGCAVFECENDKDSYDEEGVRWNPATFDVVGHGDLDNRAALFRDREKYIGEKYTVKFFGRTEDGIPRFPVGKMFRDVTDLETK